MENNFKNYQLELSNFCLSHKKIKNNHNIQIENYQKSYQDFYSIPRYVDFEKNMCKQFEAIENESMLVFEKFIGE